MALSWLGLLLHNLVESVDGSSGIMAMVAVVFFLVWRRLRFRRLAAGLLVLWSMGHLVGGATLSLIRFDFLPFDPPQTLIHYFAHVLYGLAQLPLLAVMGRQILQSL